MTRTEQFCRPGQKHAKQGGRPKQTPTVHRIKELRNIKVITFKFRFLIYLSSIYQTSYVVSTTLSYGPLDYAPIK